MLSYMAKNGISQIKLLMNREPIDEYLSENKVSPEKERQLRLIQKARDFCFNELKLKTTKNYSQFVQLEGEYVSYLLRVAPKYKLESYVWSFPIVGKFPYLGFFNKQDALDEKEKYKLKDYDTYIRGVPAYSTLGWFTDPVLSSMLLYKDHNLVNLIIHETIHTTIFVKDNAEFNERLANYLAQVGTDMFYEKYEGKNSKTLQLIKDESHDDQLFSKFISKEMDDLKKWYEDTKNINEPMKQGRLKQIQERFDQNISTQMKSNSYKHFNKLKLNNARLLPYLTYMSDLSEFEVLHKHLGNSFHKTLEFLKGLEKSKDPAKDLKDYVQANISS